jgi:Zn-dependent M28 family amino/carboxypeptidase
MLAAALLISAAFGAQAPAAAPASASTLTAAERQAAAAIKAATIREVTTALAANDMQGRGTATPGGEKAAKYIADRFAKLRLKPLGDAGSYFQAIRFKTTTLMPETSIKAGDAALKLGDDYVVLSPSRIDQVEVSGGLAFAGYGVASQALNRDDFAGVDLKGKIAIILSGQPKNVDAETWKKAASEQAMFIGLIGRSPAAVVLVELDQDSRQPYSLVADYLMRPHVALADAPAPNVKLPPLILASKAGAEKLFAGSSATFAEVLQKAEAGEKVSRDLGKTGTIVIKTKQEVSTGSNIAGLLEGSDAALKNEAVVYTAHYDAYGMAAGGRIFSGAADNALGVAEVIAIAEAFANSPARPRRSVIFLMVTGEEHGLLGARHWVQHPGWPLGKIAANINFDGIGTEVYGPVKQVVAFGAQYSDLGKTAESVVAATGATVIPDPMPEEQAFMRSDHYVLVRQGVPALMLLGLPAGDIESLKTRVKKWMETDYHQPTDIVRPDWNWEGPRALAEIGLVIGLRVASADQMPEWVPGSPYKRQRADAAPAR